MKKTAIDWYADDMNSAHKKRRRLQEAKILIQVELLKGDIRRAVELAQRFEITPKEFGKLTEKS